jgi:YndJ-like protein
VPKPGHVTQGLRTPQSRSEILDRCLEQVVGEEFHRHLPINLSHPVLRVMSELDVLHLLLLLSMAVGPFATNQLWIPLRPQLRLAAHGAALAGSAIGLLLPAPYLCAVWPLFCAGSLVAFVRSRAASLRTTEVLTACVPFLFSNIAAVWLVGGANNLHLLGYGAKFSYYAALHGNVLGWILLGGLAIATDRDDPLRRVYSASVFVCLASFLLIAFGIDQLHWLKPLGISGLSLALPAAEFAFLRSVRTRNRPAFALGCVSFGGLIVTLLLAWANELSLAVSIAAGDVRGMVSVHGVVNALVVGPCFLAAVSLDRHRESHGRKPV